MDDRIRVAIVCTSLNQMGGKTVHFKNMYLSLKNKGIHMTIVFSSSLEKEYRRFMEEGGIAQEDLIFIPRFKKWLIAPFISELKNILIARKIDIVHTFQIQSDFFGALAARIAGINCVVSQQESIMIEEILPFYKKLFYRYANALLRGSFKRTVVVSEGLKEELVSSDYRSLDKIETIPLGINLPEEYRNRSFSFKGLKSGSPVIGTIGRLNKEKGIDRFINAMPFIIEKVPEAKFIIVGQGEEKERLKELVRKINLEAKVQFRDIPWSETVYNALEGIDIFVMPSLREGCPIALLEAMALARPVVASKVDGIIEIIKDGKDGLTVDTSNPGFFAEKVLYLCKNPQVAIAIGEEGRKKVLNRYTMNIEMERYWKLYRQMIANNN